MGANAVMLVFGTLPYGLCFMLTLYAQQVLGYSAVKFGLTSLVFPAMAAVGSILGQAIVLRVGFRPVAAVGMALMGGRRAAPHPGLRRRQLLRRHLLRAARLRPRRRPRLRHRLDRGPRRRPRARVRDRLRPQQHALPDRRGARGRHRHDRRRLPHRRLPGGEHRRRPAGRPDGGLPVRLPRRRRSSPGSVSPSPSCSSAGHGLRPKSSSSSSLHRHRRATDATKGQPGIVRPGLRADVPLHSGRTNSQTAILKASSQAA